jgi:hypothetical protein
MQYVTTLTDTGFSISIVPTTYQVSLARVGGQGSQGFSAYELAVQNGYTGTEAEYVLATATDAAAIAADRVQTGLDRIAADGSATTATTQAGIATTQAGLTAIDAAAVAASVPYFGTSPPVSPIAGRSWVDTNTGRTFEWFEDSTSSQWIEIGAVSVQGFSAPQSYATAPPYVKGTWYFDTTLNKLRVGGATAWETVTSV